MFKKYTSFFALLLLFVTVSSYARPVCAVEAKSGEECLSAGKGYNGAACQGVTSMGCSVTPYDPNSDKLATYRSGEVQYLYFCSPYDPDEEDSKHCCVKDIFCYRFANFRGTPNSSDAYVCAQAKQKLLTSSGVHIEGQTCFVGGTVDGKPCD